MLKNQKKLSKFITMGPAPSHDELKQLAKEGFKLIINLSQRGELDQELSPDEEGEAVGKLDMQYIHMPTSVSRMKHQEVDSFISLISRADGPTYVHCRLGQRTVPFAMIYYGIKRKLSTANIFDKINDLGISFRAPVLRSFIENYFELKHSKAA